jgi:hypothetical protein
VEGVLPCGLIQWKQLQKRINTRKFEELSIAITIQTQELKYMSREAKPV